MTFTPGSAKLDFLQRLGEDWKKVADLFEIPTWERPSFQQGDESRHLWEWLERRNMLWKLPDALKDEHVNREDLLEVVEIAILPSKELNNIIIEHRSKFEKLFNQIKEFAEYKYLHNQLHQLQFECYSILLREFKQLPDPSKFQTYSAAFANARDNLVIYGHKILSLSEDLDELKSKSCFATMEISDVQKELEKIHLSLNELLSNKDNKKLYLDLKYIIYSLKHLLAVKPTSINCRLNYLAHKLQLDLINRILPLLERNSLSDFTGFIINAESIDVLQKNLIICVNEHDEWQKADVELRWIEAQSIQCFLESEVAWQNLNRIISPLCNGTYRWAEQLSGYARDLEVAIAQRDILEIEKNFQSYRWLAGDRFYKVDLKLKKLCENLLSVSEQLALILGKGK